MAYSTPTAGTWTDCADTSSGAGGMTVPVVGGTTEGRLLLLFAAFRPSDLASWTTPSGWTELAASDDGGYEEVKLCGKIGAASESAPNLDTGAVQSIGSGVMVSFPGAPASITGIVDAWAETSRDDYVTAHVDVPTPGITTPSQNDCLIIYFAVGNALRGAASARPNSSNDLFSYHEYDGTFNDLTVWAAYTIQTAAAAVGASSFDLSSSSTLRSKGVVVALKSGATTTKFLKALISSAAAGLSSVAGTVFEAPVGVDITGAKIGEFTGQSFLGANSLDGGKAKLLVNVSSFGGSALTTANTPHVYLRTSSFDTGIFPATVIEV